MKKGDIFSYRVHSDTALFIFALMSADNSIRAECLEKVGAKDSSYRPKGYEDQATGHWWNLGHTPLEVIGNLEDLEDKETFLKVMSGSDIEGQKFVLECLRQGSLFKPDYHATIT